MRVLRVVPIVVLAAAAAAAACEEEEPPGIPCACDTATGGLVVTLAPTCPAPVGLPVVRIDADRLEPDDIRCLDDGIWVYTWPDWALNGTIGTVVNDGTEASFIVDRVACVAVTMGCTIEGVRP